MEGNISHIPVKQDGHNFFMAHVQVSRKGYSILHNMTGTASILINKNYFTPYYKAVNNFI
ncbi:hypothetical protein HMPREF0660_00516 [Prevotella melaninogenica D18]|nr:hypothetical protein HMPREF0660_00516 [Prevotella melaninogenica D18]